jgi:alpha-galactosidase
MAEVSKELGIELFVIDDGWFKGRNNDFTSLGDWVADLNKFPKGIGHFADKIHNLGLKFGIWVEPEMISMESDLFKAHPEFALMSPKRFPLERRHQLIIDLTNPEVINYLDEVLSNLISETKADYIKWDFNRSITDIYSSYGTKRGEYFHKFVLGLYDLLDRLTSKFPNVLFEGCASGGGRFDLGIAYYFPQTWGSDNSNSSCRLRIASGTFMGYPISNFGSHIAREHFNDSPYYYSCLEDRFNIQAFGAFGYEFDVRKTNEFEREIIKEQIKYFKEHRKLFVYGDYFNIDNIFDDPRYCSFSTVSTAKDEAMLFAAVVDKSAPSKTWKFKNLNKDFIYEIEVRSQYNQKEFNIAPMSGYDLMKKGVDLGNFIDPNLENEEFQSRLIYIKKI